MARKDPDQLTALRRTKYLGSHPRVSGQIRDLDVIFTAHQIRFRKRSKSIGEVTWADVRSLHADDEENFEVVGSKRRNLSYLVITDRAGRWVFEVPNLTKVELRSGLDPLQKFVPPQDVIRESSPPVVPPSPAAMTPFDRLKQLQEMHDAGLVSEAEFTAKRAQLLDEL